MHDTAYNNAKEFVEKYVLAGSLVLDVGSMDVNGSLKPLFENCNYIGMDMESGNNVDIVCNSHKMPFDINPFDVIVSTSAFEHDFCFWETFREMCRVVKAGGLIYINAPSAGAYHSFPYDCWRFYADSGKALEYWINTFTPYRVILIEQKINEEGGDGFKDNTMIFRKSVSSRMDIINYMVRKHDYKSYLEIGCYDNACFDVIKVNHKIGIDPERGGTIRVSSDDFFKENKEKFDLIFIDGLHTTEQVSRDIENSLMFLNEGGTIVCHDMNPLSKLTQMIPRINNEWNGDGWRSWVNLKATRDDLSMFVIDTDYGVGIIRKGAQTPLDINCDITYENLALNKAEWLNLISVNDFLLKYKIM